MDREMPLGTHAAQWLLRRAWFRRALRVPFIGKLLEHPWRGFVVLIWVFILSRLVVVTLRALAEPWRGSIDQWLAALLPLILFGWIVRFGVAWARGGWAGVKKTLPSQWREMIEPPSEEKWHLSMLIGVPIILLVVILAVAWRG